FDAFLAGEFGNMDKAFDSLLHFDERAELCESHDLAFNHFSGRVAIFDRVPGISENLLEAQAEAGALFVQLQYDSLDALAFREHVARALNALGPGHFRNVDQTFHARHDLDESAEVRQPRDLSRYAVARIQGLHCLLPGI